MNKYKAWIAALTPLNFANEKSLEQIINELIPILFEIKKTQDNDNTSFNDFLTLLKNKISEIKESLTTHNTSFDEKRNSIRQNVSNKESEITNNILAKFSEMLSKIENFGSSYFENHPEVFNSGIDKVNFDLNINNSAYKKWYNNTEVFYTSDNINYGKTNNGYSYDHITKLMYYDGNEISNASNTAYGTLNRCTNGVIINYLPKLNLGEKLLPANENGYFIGFPDETHAAYFAEANEENVEKYSIKLIDLNTKEMTTYTDLLMPSNFNNVYLSNNSHYIIKKYHDYYYLVYLVNGQSVPYIAKSNDLIHWANMGSLNGSIVALQVIHDSLYFVTTSYSSYLFNESDNTFNQIKYNNKNIMVGSPFGNNYLGVVGNEIMYSSTPDFSSPISLNNTINPINNTLAFAVNTQTKDYLICGCNMSNIYNEIYQVDNEYQNIRFKDDKNFNALYLIDYKLYYSTIIRGGKQNSLYYIGTGDISIGDIVISPDYRIFDDKNLQEITFTHECVEVK